MMPAFIEFEDDGDGDNINNINNDANEMPRPQLTEEEWRAHFAAVQAYVENHQNRLPNHQS
jgi:hypothetical protein